MTFDPNCKDCAGGGVRDSGGFHPWGEGIAVRCDCDLPDPSTAHDLKTDPETFDDLVDGLKTFEIRKFDRGFKVGHLLRLRRTRNTGAEMREGLPLIYTGQECIVLVKHILTGYGLLPDWCVMSIEIVSIK